MKRKHEAPLRDQEVNATERREINRHSSTASDSRRREELERMVRFQQCGGGRRIIRKGPSSD